RRAIALLASCRSIALDDFFTGDGRSHFLHRAGRSPFTTFSQSRAIALLVSCRSIALNNFFTGGGRSHFLHRAGRSPFTTF
ncbi:hypothetical protein QUB68_24195, partial [Microcoleus sp. A006_D1]|uniref:hypothetical protein n=1 Tax=Microcoleus sp. A006_D1 TaxID=3055267 RepID=UPI002FD73CBD